MTNRNVKLKNLSGDYLYPYTENIPTATTSQAGKVQLDSSPVSGSSKAITSGAVYTALAGKLATTGTAAKATADANGNNIANTYLKKSDEGKGGLNLLVNQLQKAYAWTWSQTLTSGTVYVVYNNSGAMLDGVACTSYCQYGGYNGYVGINGNMYCYNTYASPVTLTQKTSDGDITMIGYGNCIKGGKLYSFFNNAYTDNNTGWTTISGFFGIRNGALCTFNNQSTLKCGVMDTGGTWTAVTTGYNDGTYCAGIRDGYPYYASRTTSYGLSSLVQLDTENGWSMVTVASSGYFYFAKGSQYKCFYQDRTTVSCAGDVGSEIKKLYYYYALTTDGKVYQINYNTPKLLSSDVIDICSWGYLKSDGLYNYSGTKITDGTFTAASGVMLYAGAGTTQYKTVYTVANPAVNYKTYERLDLTYSDTVTAASSTTITNSSKTYTRDIANDKVFSQTPDDLKKQTPTKWELIDMINNLT